MKNREKRRLKIIGARFKELRKSKDTIEKDFTQAMLADELDFTVSQISKLESGNKKPSLESIEKYANYFGVSTDYLLGRSEYAKTDCTDLNIFNEKTLKLLYGIKFRYDNFGERRDVDLLNILLGTKIGDKFIEKLSAYIFNDPENFEYIENGKIKHFKEINVISKKGGRFNLFSNEVSSILKNDLLNIIDLIKADLRENKYTVEPGVDGINYFMIRSMVNTEEN